MHLWQSSISYTSFLDHPQQAKIKEQNNKAAGSEKTKNKGGGERGEDENEQTSTWKSIMDNTCAPATPRALNLFHQLHLIYVFRRILSGWGVGLLLVETQGYRLIHKNTHSFENTYEGSQIKAFTSRHGRKEQLRTHR